MYNYVWGHYANLRDFLGSICKSCVILIKRTPITLISMLEVCGARPAEIFLLKFLRNILYYYAAPSAAGAKTTFERDAENVQWLLKSFEWFMIIRVFF